MTLQTLRKKYAPDILFVMLLAAGSAFMLWKAPYGFHFSDEAYYLTVPYRMVQGDKLFRDMWDIGQFSMLPTLPLMRLYLKIFGTTESMVLHFRYIYLFFHMLFSLCLYLILRRSSPLGAFFAAAVYMLFSPINIMQFSYNSYGIGFITLSGALMAENRKKILAGVLYALAVLSCPFAAVLFPVFSAAAAIKRNKEKTAKWRSFALGTVGTALVFLAYVQFTAGLGEMIRTLPEIFKNPTHHVDGVSHRLAGLVRDLLLSRKPVAAGLAVQLVVTVVYLVSGKKKSLRGLLCLAAAAAAVFGMLYEMKTDRWINCLMVPVTYMGLPAYVLSEKKNKALMRYLYIPGLLFGVSVYLGSDLGYMTMSGAFTVSAVAAVYFIARLTPELFAQRGWTMTGALALALALVCQLGAQVWYRKNFCFSELYNTSMMIETVEKGSGKGEKTSFEAVNYEFRQVWDSSRKVREYEGEYVLYFSKDCWLYLEDEKRCAAQSAWIQMAYTVEEAERLVEFWGRHPEKTPDAIYVSAETENAERVIEILNTENFPVEKNDRGYVMLREKQ